MPDDRDAPITKVASQPIKRGNQLSRAVNQTVAIVVAEAHGLLPVERKQLCHRTEVPG